MQWRPIGGLIAYRRIGAALILLAPLVTVASLDAMFPLPLPDPEATFSRVVTASDGAPLRAFADRRGVWRYPVTSSEVSPLYLQAVIAYEDRHFWRHGGVNPLALARAVWQSLHEGRIVSGGSTLTMQLARLLDPHARTALGKSKQILRALQLEWHLSKQQILNHYLNVAPFGGPLQGVEAASYAYLGKSARELSHSEAALLAILPQAPSRLRPDRYAERARRARDKVLRRMAHLGLWPQRAVRDALMEPVVAEYRTRPTAAPLLARRLLATAKSGNAIRSTIDYRLQSRLETRLASLAGDLPERTSVALLVVENRSLAVRAYVGSVAYGDASHFGYVDMVRAVRSPGSTLKPFLYGFALEDGLIHSESLLSDVPMELGAYRPGNFDGGFSGPVGASAALRRSLNVPAVQLLTHLTPDRFMARLERGGLRLRLGIDARPNLAVILGGAGSTLEELAAAYAALARDGLSGKLRFLERDAHRPRYMMSPAAAWVVRRILSEQPRAGSNTKLMSHSRRIAWKTGTSYGFRDAWSIGVDSGYTVGVWVGRPDGTPMPGHYGAVTASPIMFSIFDMLPAGGVVARARPPGVTERDICLPLGTPPEAGRENLCHLRRRAFIVDGVTPRTLADVDASHWQDPVRLVRIDPVTGRRINESCSSHAGLAVEIAQWPLSLQPWLPDDILARSRPPPLEAGCAAATGGRRRDIRITGIADGVDLRRGADGTLPRISVTVLGASGTVYWLVNGDLKQSRSDAGIFTHRFTAPGRQRITAIDASGNHSSVSVHVK